EEATDEIVAIAETARLNVVGIEEEPWRLQTACCQNETARGDATRKSRKVAEIDSRYGGQVCVGPYMPSIGMKDDAHIRGFAKIAATGRGKPVSCHVELPEGRGDHVRVKGRRGET